MKDSILPILVSIISLTGVLLSSIFGYISSYYGSKRSARIEQDKINDSHKKRIEQENKFEKDKILRQALQALTLSFYNDTFNPDLNSTYFNTIEGKQSFYTVMSDITAYGSEDSVHTVIYLQKAIAGVELLKNRQEKILGQVKNKPTFSIDWVRYETNALAAIMIAQLRYDISGEFINPKELISVKFNNVNKDLKQFFETGIDEFLELNQLIHLKERSKKNEHHQI